MNARGRAYFAYIGLRGSQVPRHYRAYLEDDAHGPAPDTSLRQLSKLLRHCRENVPHYRELLRALPDPDTDPLGVLQQLPILTKRVVRDRFDALKSRDLAGRRWWVSTSGGSTGEPARFVQDAEYAWRTGAVALAYSRWVGHEVGDPLVLLWGSERDVLQGTDGAGAKLVNAWTRTTFLNAFRMTPDAMLRFVEALRRAPPRLIVAYAQRIYDFAGFVDAKGIPLAPVPAVITSAGTLHDFMRERIGRVFQAKVYDRYGSREVGLIAAERPGIPGLWVPPWNVLLEIVDGAGRPVPPGTTGEILVTSLVNHAMPLIRYRIGDVGALGPARVHGGQILTELLGRSVDAFRRRDGTLVDGSFFTRQVYFREWVEKFQFVQTGYDEVVFRVVSRTADRARIAPDLEVISQHTKAALGPGAVLRVEWVDDIRPAPSGKYRYTISEVPAP